MEWQKRRKSKELGFQRQDFKTFFMIGKSCMICLTSAVLWHSRVIGNVPCKCVAAYPECHASMSHVLWRGSALLGHKANDNAGVVASLRLWLSAWGLALHEALDRPHPQSPLQAPHELR